MAKQNGPRRTDGAATGKIPGNQTPNTPDVNESEIARLTVDQLRGRLRRRGITGTGELRKPELVDALVQALREGRRTTRSTNRRTSDSRATGSRRSDSRRPAGRADAQPRIDQLADAERRAAELADAPPEQQEVEQAERRAAELEGTADERTGDAAIALPAAPARPELELESAAQLELPAAAADAEAATGTRVPPPRSGDDAGGEAVPPSAGGRHAGPTLTMATADRVVTELVPPGVDEVDQVLTPEGTMITDPATP